MPVSRDRFEEIAPEEEATTAELIVTFLYENRDQAFTRKEIATEIARNPNTVATNLTRLKKRALVQHRGQYWAITDDFDRLADAIQFSEALSGLNERFGPLIENEADAQKWANAQPAHPHPSEQSTSDETADSDTASENEPDP